MKIMKVTFTAPDGSTFVESVPQSFTHASIYMGEFGWRTRACSSHPHWLKADIELMFDKNPRMTDRRYSIVEIVFPAAA